MGGDYYISNSSTTNWTSNSSTTGTDYRIYEEYRPPVFYLHPNQFKDLLDIRPKRIKDRKNAICFTRKKDE